MNNKLSKKIENLEVGDVFLEEHDPFTAFMVLKFTIENKYGIVNLKTGELKVCTYNTLEELNSDIFRRFKIIKFKKDEVSIIND